MKRYDFLVVLFFLLLMACNKNNDEQNLINNLKGNVKSVIESNYSATGKNGEIQKGNLKDKNVRIYDEKGNVIEISYFGSDGNLIHKYNYKYDSNENIVEQNWYVTAGNYGYKMINKIEGGDLIESNIYSLEGVLMENHIYVNNSKGFVAEKKITIYQPSNSKGGKYTYKYDDEGRKIEECYYRYDGTLYSIFTYEYKNNITIEHRQRFQMGLYNIYLTTRYDEKGYVIELNNADSEGYKMPTRTYIYDKYDKFGNWIERKELWADELKIITEREMDYY